MLKSGIHFPTSLLYQIINSYSQACITYMTLDRVQSVENLRFSLCSILLMPLIPWILIMCLAYYALSPTANHWFQSYLSRQRIHIEDSFSSWCNITAGVPQGGVLSPLLLSVFINSIPMQIASSYHLYANDMQILYQTSPDHFNM